MLLLHFVVLLRRRSSIYALTLGSALEKRSWSIVAPTLGSALEKGGH